MRFSDMVIATLAVFGFSVGFVTPGMATTIDVTVEIERGDWWSPLKVTHNLMNTEGGIYYFSNEEFNFFYDNFEHSFHGVNYNRIEIEYNKNKHEFSFVYNDIYCDHRDDGLSGGEISDWRDANGDCFNNLIKINTKYDLYRHTFVWNDFPSVINSNIRDYVKIQVHGYEDVPFNAIPLPLPGALLIGGLAALGVAARRAG